MLASRPLSRILIYNFERWKKLVARRSSAKRFLAAIASGPNFSACSIRFESATRSLWKLDRLARSTRDLLETMETIRQAGGRFRSLSEPWADTTTHAGKMIMTIFAGIAEFERDLIRERTGAGREAARKRGVRFGRPRKLSLDQEQLARRLVLEGKSASDIARTFNVHVATIYRLAQMQ